MVYYVYNAVFLLIIPVLLLVFWQRRKREDDLAAATVSAGLTVFTEIPEEYLPLLPADGAGLISTVSAGSFEGETIWLFDFSYEDPSTLRDDDSKETSVACVHLPERIPQFELYPVHFLDKLAAALGRGGIKLPGHPKFSKRYSLKGPNEAKLVKYFDGPVAEFFEAHPKLSVKVHNSRMVLLANRLIRPKELKEFFELAQQLCSVLKKVGKH